MIIFAIQSSVPSKTQELANKRDVLARE